MNFANKDIDLLLSIFKYIPLLKLDAQNNLDFN